MTTRTWFDQLGPERVDEVSCTGGRETIEDLSVCGHAKTMIQACWQLGGPVGLAVLRLRDRAPRLGFRGYCLTRTRSCSTTPGYLREARQTRRPQQTQAAHGLETDGPVHHYRGAELQNLDALSVLGDDTVLLAETPRIWRRHRAEREAA